MFVNTVPTAATRRGDFSDYRDRNGNLILIYDPLTTRPNPNGTGRRPRPVPRQHHPGRPPRPGGPQRRRIYPLPNGPGNFDNYTSTAEPLGARPQFTGRVDHRAGDRDSSSSASTTGSSSSTRRRGRPPAAWPRRPRPRARFDLGPFVAGIQNTRLTTHGRRLNWTHLFGPTVVNELRVGFAKTNPETRQSDYGHQAATSLGIQGINVSEFTTGLPNINIQDVTGISGGPAFLPVNPKQIHYQVEDTLSWVKGRHRSSPATASSGASRRRSPTPTRAAASPSTAT